MGTSRWQDHSCWELQAPRIAPWPISVSLGSHLLLNCTCHGKSVSCPHLAGANMSQVDKIHWLSNHGPVNPSSLLLRLGFLYHTAAQFVPKFTHVPRRFQLPVLPGAPQGSCSGAGTTHSSLCDDVLWFTPQDRFRESGILGTLRHAGKVSASDPERLTGQPGARLCLHQTWKPAPLGHRGVQLQPVGGSRSVLAGAGLPGWLSTR